ncbi:Tyrosine recombinase XerC [Candidatus Cyrtobacter comes]|uniref:Tyrosine recombinase XerC n=1 Tax=Candidatus Cyrtobacter comes TaxID=675776 RepID=A0ABU5L7T5_9RICK|nr:tyrosine-type recombinase/integrase [Candidatus Cyrtobacter comes]MDZ5762191.1 Tyrosine recombinase XerC [Candidatus Cyrtobacter comes]
MKDIRLNHKLEGCLGEWINYLKNNKKYSENTMSAYFTDVVYFLLFISEAYQEEVNLDILSEITIQDMRSWLAYRRNENKKASSSARAIASVRSFFGYIKVHNGIDNANVFVIKIRNKEKNLPKSLPLESVFEAIAKIPSFSKREWVGLRDKAILFLLYGCGLRISEALTIEQKDILTDDRQILIKGKGGNERLVPLLDIVQDAVFTYIQSCPYTTLVGPIFKGNNGKKLNPNVFRSNLRKLKYAIGLPEYMSPHAFRHSFATHLLNQSGQIKLIQEMLGHKNLSTTQKYTKVDIGTIASNYYLYHPKTQKK